MAGLMSDPFFAVGQGLLRSSVGANPWSGIGDGLLMQKQAQQHEAMQSYRDMQMQEMQRQQQEAAAQQQQEAQQRAYMEQAMRSVPPELQAAFRANPALFQKYMEQQIAPAPAIAPSSAQKDYEFALTQGYKGSFVEFKRDMAASGATKIDMGGNDRVSVADAAGMVFKDGSPVPPGILWEEARAKGVRALTAGDREVSKMESKGALAEGKAQVPINDYAAAVERWRTAPTDPGANAAMQQERRRLAQVLAQARNPGRAPTDADVEVALRDIPSPISVADLFATKMGGDPFNERLIIIAKELGATLSSPGNAQRTAPAMPPSSGTPIDALKAKYPNLIP